MLVFLISVAVTLFLLAAAIILLVTGTEPVYARLMAVAARPTVVDHGFEAAAPTGLGRLATGFTTILKPIRNLIAGNEEDLSYRFVLAGLRKPEHIEVYTAAKMLLPIVAIVAASFAGSNMAAVALIGGAVGFFGPDVVLTQLIARRRDSIRRALPDALDLLMICMEAGLGIDQAMVRVGEEVRLTCPVLADEFQIINREQRAGKPRLEAWRSMAERVDLDFVRQFVTMLVQTERFGTPIADALGQFADSLRLRRLQAAEEMAAKTGVKLLFPLVLFIFPSIFVVVLGPAILNIEKGLSEFLK